MFARYCTSFTARGVSLALQQADRETFFGTIPNIMTMARIALAPAVCYWCVQEQFDYACAGKSCHDALSCHPPVELTLTARAGINFF